MGELREPGKNRPELAWTVRSGTSRLLAGKSDLIAAIDDFVAAVERLDIVPNKSSRVLKARETIELLREKDARKLSAEEQRLLTSAMRVVSDVHQLRGIVTHCALSADDRYVEKARLLFNDALAVEMAQAGSSPGRDTQFELFTAACWSAVGVHVELGVPPAPDFLIATPPWEFGIEVKRIKKAGQIKKRAKDAKKQLSHCPAGGILVTDLSLFFTDMVGTNIENALTELEKRLYKFMFARHADVRAATSRAACFSWTAYAEIPCVDASQAGIAFQWKTFNLSAEDDTRWLHIVKYTSALNAVLAPRAGVVPAQA